MLINRKKAEAHICRLRDELLLQYPNCQINFVYELDSNRGFTDFSNVDYPKIQVGISDLFPVDEKNRPLTKDVDAIAYVSAVHTMIHEFAHVDQMEHPSSLDIKLATAAWKCNFGLFYDLCQEHPY